MRHLTVSEMKRDGQPSIPDRIPRPGTNVRRLYDFFYERRGRPIDRRDVKDVGGRNYYHILSTLCDRWGCDIRNIDNGSRADKLILPGEWDGKIYIDYSKEAEQEAQKGPSNVTSDP